MKRVHRLVIVSHVIHYQHAGQLYAYGPYTREIDVWADLFPEVLIASPCRHEPPPGDCIPFTRANIAILPQRETGGPTLRDKIKQVLLLPLLLLDLCRALRMADAIHVRCPGNLGLLGAWLAPLFSRQLVAKYAGQWNGYAGEPLSVRLQRAVLGSRWWRGPVTVYGHWPQQPAHVVSFFTSMMTAQQVERAASIAAAKGIHRPLRVLYTGVLAPRKRVQALLHGLQAVLNEGVPIEVTLVGDGPERQALVKLAHALGLDEHLTFIGALPFDEGLAWYAWADCLVLPSQHSEGWPKVVAEAMCHGLVCIAVNHGQVAEMLDQRGILLTEGSPLEIAAALTSIARRPTEFQAMQQAAAVWARCYSLEGLREALAALLSEHWKMPVRNREYQQPPLSNPASSNATLPNYEAQVADTPRPATRS